MLNRGSCILFAVAILTGVAGAATGTWNCVFSDDFTSPSGWTYAGVKNTSGQNLIGASAGCVQANYDQSNNIQDWGYDPFTLVSSSYTHPLSQMLTENDTFRFGATIRIQNIAETENLWPVMNFGLYDVATTGQDRSMTDDWSGNTHLVRDASDMVEFNYWINDAWGGRAATANMAAHLGPTETAGKYTTGSYTDPLYHQVLLGEGNALPTNTNLYVEVTYYGSGTNARRVYSAIYTDPAHTQLLVVNGVEQYYWTQPLPAGQRFMLTDVGFWNYVDSNWDSLGRAGTGSGIFDDLYVQQLMPVLGDFNGDGVRNAADIDLLQAHMGDPAYDLNGDGVTNQADLTMLLNSLLGTVQGDANLDRKVNFSDFQVVLDNWQKSSIWATGDFNGDRITNFGDFQYLLDNWNKSVVTTAVPEPATLAPLAFGAAALVVRPRRKSTGR